MKELNSRSENIKRNETPKFYESKTCWIEKISHANYIVQRFEEVFGNHNMGQPNYKSL